MKRIIFALLALLLLTVPQLSAPAAAQQENCLFFTETGGGQGGFSVCDDADARFRSAFESWGLLSVGYPVSQRYTRDGFVTQAFQKAIMQWRPESGSVALVNIFDDLHNSGFDQTLLERYQTPKQLPAGWDGEGLTFEQVVVKRQALLDERPALRAAYFASDEPLLFFGLPTSGVSDMDSHYAIRLQRAVLQEWKIEVPWAKAGEVTIANGGDIAKALGGLPAQALVPEASAPAPSEPVATGCSDNNSTFVSDVTIPDDTVMAAGERFVKTWRFQNNGSCPWTTGYQFVFIGDQQMNAPSTVPLNQEVQANGTIDLSVNFTAPTTPGTYRSTWQLSTPEGTRFGDTAYVQIVVADENVQPEPSALSKFELEFYAPYTLSYDASKWESGIEDGGLRRNILRHRSVLGCSIIEQGPSSDMGGVDPDKVTEVVIGDVTYRVISQEYDEYITKIEYDYESEYDRGYAVFFLTSPQNNQCKADAHQVFATFTK